MKIKEVKEINCFFLFFLEITNPFSLNDFNCVFVNRLGSPVPSIATTSSSSNGGAINKSRRFIGRYRRFVFVPLPDNGLGRTVPKQKSH